MPHIVFTIEEVAGSVIERMHRTSSEILELSDLNKKPLDPGESPDARRHKIAKLGKQLAEACQAFEAIVQAASGVAPPKPTADEPDQSKSN